MLISEANFMKPVISPVLKYVHDNMNYMQLLYAAAEEGSQLRGAN